MIPEGDVQRLKEFGDKISELVAHPIQSISGTGNSIELKLDKPQPVNQIILQEDITKGERIRDYHVEGLTPHGWKTLCHGESVGHKRIQTFSPVTVGKIRFVINKQVDIPQIINFSVYNIDQ